MKTEYHYFKNIDSTNMEAARQIAELDDNALHIIFASQQSKGKGQGSHKWICDYDKNILMSIVAKKMDLEIEKQFAISQIAALSVCKFIEKELPKHTISIKWPNDIIINDKKIGGILIENNCIGKNIEETIIGIGININQSNFPDELPNAISLFQIDGKERNIRQSIEKIDSIFKVYLKKLQNKKFNQISSCYNEKLHKINEISTFTDGISTFSAKILFCMPDGQLAIEMEDGTKKMYYHHEIQMSYDNIKNEITKNSN